MKNRNDIINQGMNVQVVDAFFLFMLFLGYLEERGFTEELLARFKQRISQQPSRASCSIKKMVSESLDEQPNSEDLKALINKVIHVRTTNVPNEEVSLRTDHVLNVLDTISKMLSTKQRSKEHVITERFIDSLVQRFMTKEAKRKSGSYYTPEEITRFITEVTLKTFLVNDDYQSSLLSLTSSKNLFNDDSHLLTSHGLDRLQQLKILEPSVGAGHFVIAMLNLLTQVWMTNLKSDLHLLEEFISQSDETTRAIINKIRTEEHDENSNFWKIIELIVRIQKCLPALHGTDLNSTAILACQIRLTMIIFDVIPRSWRDVLIPWISENLQFNFVVGDALTGFSTWNDVNLALKTSSSTRIHERMIKSLITARDDLVLAEGMMAPNHPIFQGSKENLEFNQVITKIHSILKQLEKSSNEQFQGLLIDLLTSYQRMKRWLMSKKDKIETTLQIIHWMQALDRLITQIVDITWEEFTNHQVVTTRPIHWFLAFPEVFHLHQGFDLVIGNPPYLVEVRENKKIFRRLKESPLGKKYYEQKTDVFYFFISLGIDILRNDGILGFIVPEYWINRKHAKKLRQKIFSDTIPLLFFFFGDHSVFSHAPGHHDMIIILQKKKPEELNGFTPHETLIWHHECHSGTCHDDQPLNWLDDLAVRRQRIREHQVPPDTLYEPQSDMVHVGSSQDYIKFDQIRKKSFFLEPAEIQLGLTAPQNEVTRRALKKHGSSRWNVGEGIFVLRLSEFRRYSWTAAEMLLFKPFFTGRDLKPFEFSTTIQRLIMYMDQENLKTLLNAPHHYRHVMTHLNRFKPLITSDHAPYGLHRARQPIWFEDVGKIIGVRKTSRPRFAVVPLPFYVDLSCIIIRPHRHEHVSPYYVTALLNSSLGHELLHYLKHQGKQLQVDKSVLLKFPFLQPKKEEQHAAITWLSKALHCLKIARHHYSKISDSMITTLAEVLDQLITALVEGFTDSTNNILQAIVSTAPSLRYPTWLEPPTTSELMNEQANKLPLKINKEVMTADVTSIMMFLKSSLT